MAKSYLIVFLDKKCQNFWLKNYFNPWYLNNSYRFEKFGISFDDVRFY